MSCFVGNDSDDLDYVDVSFLDLDGENLPPEPPAESTRREPSALFQLARRLMGKGHTTAASCKKLVELFCKQERLRFRDSWIEFNLAWEEVKYPAYGIDGFEVATAKAKRHPISLVAEPPEPKDAYVLLASIAFFLSEHNKGNEFLLPVKRLMKPLNLKKRQVISGMLKWLKTHDVIRTNEKYSFGGRRPCAKKYVLGTGITKVQ